MGRIVVVENVTLDGVMQAPGRADEDTRGGFRRGGWAAPYADPVMAETMGKGMAADSVMLFGRWTYELMHRSWGGRADGNPYTEVLERKRKYVASRTLAEPLYYSCGSFERVHSGVAAARRWGGGAAVRMTAFRVGSACGQCSAAAGGC